MGILKEWLDALGQASKNPDKVIEGIVNDSKFDNNTLAEDEKNEIIRRRIICEICPFMSINAVELGNYVTKRKDKHCSLCKCPIKSKTASLSSNCAIEKLNKTINENKFPLKWEAYKSKKDD